MTNGWTVIHNTAFIDEQNANVEIDENLSEHERVQLAAENEQLYAKSLQLDSDIQKIEKQMVEVYRLQETFAEKVKSFKIFCHVIVVLFAKFVAN